MLNDLTKSDKKQARKYGKRLIVLPIGLCVWVIGLFVADIWMRPYESSLTFLLGPFRGIWENTNGPGLIPIVILVIVTIFFIIVVVRGIDAFKNIVNNNVADQTVRKLLLGITDLFFVFLLVFPTFRTIMIIYNIYSDWWISK